MKKDTHLYIHIPFCRHRCDYCSFYSVDDFTIKTRYIKALKMDVVRLAKEYQSKNISLKTLYFGGGSPAVLSVSELEDILNSVYSNFDCNIDECTFELNPHQVSIEYAKGIRNLGVNRISLGVQSFSQSYLNDIGRKAKADKSKAAYYILRDAGYDNISLDLIYGGPNTSVVSVQQDLDQFIKLNPEHISTYCLSVDSDCKLDKRLKTGIVTLPDEDNIASQMEFITEYLPANNYDRYEISNYAKQGFESKHNMAYWHYKDTLGAGAAAVYTFEDKRIENYPDIEKYLLEVENGNFPLGEIVHLDKDEQFIEFLIMGLRLKEGIKIENAKEKYNIDLQSELKGWIIKYQKMGLILLEDGVLRFTDEGLNLSNAILSDLF